MVVLLDLKMCEQSQCQGHFGKMEEVCCPVTVVQIDIAELALRQLPDFEGQNSANRSQIM
jgi:hypothetical protein